MFSFFQNQPSKVFHPNTPQICIALSTTLPPSWSSFSFATTISILRPSVDPPSSASFSLHHGPPRNGGHHSWQLLNSPLNSGHQLKIWADQPAHPSSFQLLWFYWSFPNSPRFTYYKFFGLSPTFTLKATLLTLTPCHPSLSLVFTFVSTVCLLCCCLCLHLETPFGMNIVNIVKIMRSPNILKLQTAIHFLKTLWYVQERGQVLC